jgi:hypothetical protein
VIKLLKGAFEAAGLPLYLAPYGCLPTGYEKGIIEVVPNTKSRAALGGPPQPGAGLLAGAGPLGRWADQAVLLLLLGRCCQGRCC